ncbi:ComF family protein [Roseivirga pacifica]|uniref:ComF family protein n=1 Tax=Roseivirga pacifica TaxID=1267423 RepID=UPI003BAFF3C5
MELKEYFADFVSLFFPAICVGCDSPLPKGTQHICPSCQYNLPKTNNHKAEIAAFREKFDGIVSVAHVLVYCNFHKKGLVQKLLHELKYNNCPELGEMLGRWYAHELLLNGFAEEFDLVVPVPLHPSRLKQRGYNQSMAVSRGVAAVFKLPIAEECLIRTKKSSSMTKMNKVERILNMQQSYRMMMPERLKGQRVLLIDDVLTTGSTLIACAEQLHLAKPKSVSILTLAAA